MLSLIDPTTVPPGGFRYTQAETGATLTAASLPELMVGVRNHRMANALPIPLEWKQHVLTQLCEKMPPGICRHVAGTPDIPLPPAHRPLSVVEALTGAKVLGEWLFRGFNKISQEEADARSKICSACPFNQPAEGCTTCASNAMREAVESVLGRSRTVAHDSIHTCQVCGCTLRVAVWCPSELLSKHQSPNHERKPDFCWVP
jgi:hypothetical protein